MSQLVPKCNFNIRYFYSFYSDFMFDTCDSMYGLSNCNRATILLNLRTEDLALVNVQSQSVQHSHGSMDLVYTYTEQPQH